MSRWAFCISKDVWLPSGKKKKINEFSCVSLCAHCPFSLHGNLIWTFSFPGWTDLALSASPHMKYVSLLVTFLALCWTHFSKPIIFLYWGDKGWIQHSRQSRAEVKDCLSQPAGSALPHAGCDSGGALRCEVTLLFCIIFHFSFSPWVHFCRAAFQLFGPQQVFHAWRCRTWHFPLLNFMKFLLAHFSSLLRSLWMAAQPPGVLLTSSSILFSENLLRAQSVPSSWSLMTC